MKRSVWIKGWANTRRYLLTVRWVVGGCFILTSLSAPARTLEDLLHQAMQSYPTILAQMQTKSAAETDVTASMLRFLPNPSINTQQNQVSYSGQSAKSQPAANFSVSQPIWMGGALVAGYNKADAKLNAADYGVLESRQEVSRKLITAYAEWVKAYQKIIALEESVKLHERFVEMITNRFQTGVAPQADRDLGQSRLLQAQADLDTQRSLEWTSLTTLSQLVGDPVKRVELERDIAKAAKIIPREEALDIAMQINPTIQRLSFEADAAEEEAKEIRAKALPQVSFHAEHQMNNAIIPGAPGYDAYGLVVSYSPDGGFASVASASAAFTRAEAARTQVETSKRDLLDRLNADFNEYEFSRLKQESLKHSVSLATDISDSYDRQYLVGRKSWLDLMNMVRERAQNRVQLAEAEGGLIGASHRLMVYVEGTSAFDITPKPHGSECDGAEECAKEWDKIKNHPLKTVDSGAMAKRPPEPSAALSDSKGVSVAPSEPSRANQEPVLKTAAPEPLKTKLLIPDAETASLDESEDADEVTASRTVPQASIQGAGTKRESRPTLALAPFQAETVTPHLQTALPKKEPASDPAPKPRLSLQEEVERILNSRASGKGGRSARTVEPRSVEARAMPASSTPTPQREVPSTSGYGQSSEGGAIPSSARSAPEPKPSVSPTTDATLRKAPDPQVASAPQKQLAEVAREAPVNDQEETRRMMKSIADSLIEIDSQLK